MFRTVAVCLAVCLAAWSQTSTWFRVEEYSKADAEHHGDAQESG